MREKTRIIISLALTLALIGFYFANRIQVLDHLEKTIQEIKEEGIWENR